MKIMHVLNSRIYSGAEKVVCQIIKSFRGVEGMEMVYCSPDSDIVRQMLEEQGVTYLPMETMSTKELGRVIREQKPDLIHAHDMRASFFSALCCGKIPLVSHIHNNAYDARGLSPKTVAYLLAGFKAKHILWVSNSSFEGYAFHKFFAKKSSVLYNIIDTEQIFAKKAADENTYDYDMIYVGRLTYQKDPQRLMRLCARLKEQKPDLNVAIVGTGELLEEVQNLCAELDLQNNVHFLGFQSNPIKMVHDSKAMILTSRWEGTPMCALEAMALGTPVVSTPSDGMKDIVQDGVSGYLTDDDAVMAEKLLKIMNDSFHRASLSEKGKAIFARINDEEKYQEAIAACYR
ncbi:MAG: glycosyltransferase [Oscillospiraceae bacterium]|nr:glycosyltransferase [Oscillospiraceae bacterium]